MVQDIIPANLSEWTKNLGPKESRISIFERIRNIPYGLIPGLINPEDGPVGILTHNRGSCSPKHFLLGIMYRSLKVPVKYATYPFAWADPDLHYPEELRKLAGEMPLEYHVACKAHINEKWVLVDATWDPPLKKAGFCVNEKWDGFSDTLNAVKPLEEILHENVQERVEYVREKKACYTDKQNSLIVRFYHEFNKWLDEVRANG